jgi:zinc transport system substrate-binding protein
MLSTAREIEQVLSRLAPASSDTFQTNLKVLIDEIGQLDEEIRSLFEGAQHRTFLAQHPAWGYFAADYGLQQLAIEKHGNQPSPAHLVSLIDRARSNSIRTILVQSTNNDRAAAIVAKEVEAEIVRLDPLAYDWLNGIRQTARVLSAGLPHG